MSIRPDRDKLVSLVAGKRSSLLFAGDRRRSVYDKKPHRYAEDNKTEFNCMQWFKWQFITGCAVAPALC